MVEFLLGAGALVIAVLIGLSERAAQRSHERDVEVERVRLKRLIGGGDGRG